MKNFLFSLGFIALLSACGNKPADTANTTATAPSTTTTPSTTPAANAEVAHSAVVAINLCSPSSPEEGEDLGFAIISVEDEVKKNPALSYAFQNENPNKLDIKAKDGKVAKTIDAKALMGSDCAGFVVSKEGKAPAFYPVNAVTEKTMAQINAYFQ